MSVRRLAEDTVQPAKFAFNKSNAAWAKRKIKDYPKGREASAVIPLLMRAQEQDGWVTKAAIEYVAEMLDMPLIRVLEVATFYTQFQLAPVGKLAHIQVCGTTPCMLRGSEDLMKVCKKRIAEKPFELSANGNLSWEEVECQGACVNAPMVMIFKDTYEDLTPDRLEEIIDEFEASKGQEVVPGPQIDRIFSAPVGGLTSLTEDLPVVGRRAANGNSKTSRTAKKSGAGKSKTSKSVAAETAKAPATLVQASTKKKATSPRKTGQARKPAEKSKVTASEKVDPKEKNRPSKMRKPAKPDDLKLISGVGPKIEGILNGLGIYKFEQIAKWKKAERDWVDGYLKFKGRIDRDNWVKQAKALAKGAL